MVVPPNSISFAKISERIKDLRNYITILSVFCSVLVLYCVVLIWARRRDIEDKNKVAVLQLSSTLMTGQTRTNSHQLSSKFEPVQSQWS